MAIKKEDRSKFLQKQLDEKEFGVFWNFIFSMKDIDSSYKILMSLMCNDIYMNGMVTWKQQTYADKMGVTRQSVFNMFKKLVKTHVLIPNDNNKSGSKQNTYSFDIRNISQLKRSNTGFKKKPVKEDLPTCKPGFTQPVKEDLLTCKAEFTYNKDNKSSNKDLISEEEEPFVGSSLLKDKEKEKLEFDLFLQNLDI